MKQKIALIIFLFIVFNIQKTPITRWHDRHINQINEFYPKQERSKNWDQKMIQIDQAREFLLNQQEIIVAVIDTGIDYQHPLLKDKIWKNPGESGVDTLGRDKRSNGIDDDRNGFIDDYQGWNFVTNTSDILDSHGHGTHVSGIIARIAPNVKIMPLRYFDESSNGQSHMINTIRAIEYATQMGANIINYSAGGMSENKMEKQAIERASRKNILFVAAAGNEASNSDYIGYYPAGYPIENIISVTAVNPHSEILPSSNYSKNNVDIAAPGEDIYSSLPGGGYGTLTGTSQATAFVSAIAALLMSHRQDLSDPETIIRYLVKTGTWDQHLRGKTKEATRLNAYYALTMAGSSILEENHNRDIYQTLSLQIESALDGINPSKFVGRAPSGGF